MEVERNGESEDQGFLPPEPAGPEPELGDRPTQAPHPKHRRRSPAAAPAAAADLRLPTAAARLRLSATAASARLRVPAATTAPPGQAYAASRYAYPPPQQWGYPQQSVPDNGQAVAGFVLSLVALGLLVISAGLSTIISIGCAIAGIVCSRNGKKKVEAGETPKHRGLAQAGLHHRVGERCALPTRHHRLDPRDRARGHRQQLRRRPVQHRQRRMIQIIGG